MQGRKFGEELLLRVSAADSASEARISLRGAALTQLTLGDQVLIPECIATEPDKFIYGSTLAPWPNRLEDGHYSFGSRSHQFENLDGQQNKIHGLVLDRDFSVIEHTDTLLVLSYHFGSDSAYPFEVSLIVSYTLSEQRLKVSAVANSEAEDAPFAIGFHPYFLLGENFKVTSDFSHRGVSNERMLPVGLDSIPGLEMSNFSAELDTLDHCFMGSDRVSVETEFGNFEVRAIENLPYFMLYRPKDPLFGEGSAIAIEPMSAPANIFRNEIDSVALPAGETKRFAYEIRKL